MGLRFRRSIKIAPGVRLNLGKTGSSFTVGGRGSSINFGSRGAYSNIGLSGTGLSYRSKIAGSSSNAHRETKPRTSGSNRSSNIEKKVSLVLQEDGTVVFKDNVGNYLPDEYIRLAKRQNRNLIVDWLQENCDEINNEISSAINIHLTTPPPDTEIAFTPSEFDLWEPTAPSSIFEEAAPEKPIFKEYSFLAKRISFLRKSIDKINDELQRNYERRLKKWTDKKEEFRKNYVRRNQEYKEKLEAFNAAKSDFEQQQRKRQDFIEVERLSDTTAMNKFLEEVFQNLYWPRETLISFEITKNGTEVLLDVDLPEIEDMPELYAVVNKKDLRIIYKQLSETKKRKNYFQHIHAIGFRLIGEVFVSLPSVSTVVLSGYSQRASKSTGNIVNEYLYSVRVLKKQWNAINFQNLAALDIPTCFEQFELRRKATKTGIMHPIEPF